MKTSSLTVKGQVSIPVHLRKLLGLAAGDRIKFAAENGRVYLEKEPDISAIFGIVKARKSATLEQMEEAIEQGWSRRAALTAPTAKRKVALKK